eukprot:jgi/Ulvmu1/8436/UM043_0014.1
MPRPRSRAQARPRGPAAATGFADRKYTPMPDHGMISDDEFLALGRISFAMLQYRAFAGQQVSHWARNYLAMPEDQQRLLPNFETKLQRSQKALEVNSELLTKIIVSSEKSGAIGPALSAARYCSSQPNPAVSPLDATKVRYLLKNLMRDWSSEGAAERAQSYEWIVDKARQYLPDPAEAEARPRVLVPGCGLARLPCDLAAAGFHATGNEFSFYMLITASFILNDTVEPEELPMHPWVTTSCNQRSDDDQLREVRVPDVPPRQLILNAGGNIDMVTGDFVPVFHTAEFAAVYDAVACSFFVDTAHNIVEYLQVLHHILRPGGFVFNAGPLLYHWAQADDDDAGCNDSEVSIELSLAAVRAAACGVGFVVLEESEAPMQYLADRQGLYQTTYTGVRWVLRKGAAAPLGTAAAEAAEPPEAAVEGGPVAEKKEGARAQLEESESEEDDWMCCGNCMDKR